MFKTIGLSLIYLIIFLGLYGCSCSEKPKSVSIEDGLYISDITVNEGDSGSTEFEIAVNLQRDNTDTVTVNYKVEALLATVDNATSVATAAKDFTAKTSTLTFDAESGDVQTISFTILNDTLYEHDEDFLITLTGASGANVVKGTARVTIKDNDPKPVASISITSELASTTVAENDAGRIQMKVALNVVSGVDAVVSISKSTESGADTATIGKTAADRIDYILKNASDSLLPQTGRIIIPAGETEFVVNMDVVDDGIIENTESFTLTLSNPTDVTVSGSGVSLQITDNDQFDPTRQLIQLLNDTGVTQEGAVAISVEEDIPNSQSLTIQQIQEQSNQLKTELIKEMDKSFGRDAVTQAKIGGGQAGFDFTKLDSEGNVTTEEPSGTAGAEYIPWDCVRDNNTGLVWEMKINGNLGLRAESRAHYWYDPNFATNGGVSGNKGDFDCAEDEFSQCNTAYYVADINAIKLCGLTGWRLPTIGELRSIIDYGAANNTIAYDTEYFADDLIGTRFIWTSTTYSLDPSKVWAIRFGRDAFAEEAIDKTAPTQTGIRLVNDSLLKQAQQ